ncbi:MAG: ATP phosphoribosyltransferase regulatory subunit [Acutalibacter sp.]|uniref:ATP phosphoribosyltransferase regulatory subunit n=1 Tax=Acutalibacter sp. TaxID=1918636 RepID=UPI002172EAEB|nr:ATP phosphoribosyltransferase regulatory subunit [Acutalibacter sp.]MCI9224728.1 ATP phosphoribosyltransferase regulatory subunit [Acutalibacter sp.]
MRNYSKLTPEGVRDVLFDECRAHREAQRRLTAIFTRRGYREVITPGLEYYDVFSLPGAAIPQQEMYKSTDSGGRLLVFRPDSTLPIARMAAARLQGHRRPIRLYYSQSVYRTWPELSGRSHESSQMGVELLGAAGLRADLEVIGAAIEAIKAVAGDYRIELGHAGLFRHLVERLDLPPEAREEIRATIEAKNYGALGGLLDPLGNSPEAQALRRLPRLFGGEEVLSEAESWELDGGAAQALGYLRTLYTALQELGLGQRLMVDLGLVQRNDYYTGVVFSGYVQGRGGPVLTGGRYDNLCGRFGPEMPAAGFAMDMDAAASLLEPHMFQNGAAQVLVHGEPGFEPKAQQELLKRTAAGQVCEGSVWETIDEAMEYARAEGIPIVAIVGEETRTIDIMGGRE